MDAYWAACARGELVIQRCDPCARYIHLPAEECPACGGELVFRPVSGEGTVHTYTVVHRSFVPEFRGREPYILAWIDLPEGVRAFGRVLADEVAIGQRVRVTFADDLPQWRPL
ncbi:Zn-ribbon domain-containing OB-fold protein [Nonomuraea sp. NPDC050663]|uniref:Zn-ribbon domain-containing OB-fold protein n=1 Tax=Nonomuraea sp. NPDC050663 TaxID=3364370 RepID=UPI00379AB338